MSPAERIADFAEQFPSLRLASGVRPWDADVFDVWAAGANLPHGTRCTARFVLAVWDPNHQWRAGAFDLMEALRVWDERHHRSFLAWAEAPWWA